MIGNIFQNFYLGKNNDNYNYYVSKTKLVYSNLLQKHIIVFGSCYSACDDFLEYCIEKNPRERFTFKPFRGFHTIEIVHMCKCHSHHMNCIIFTCF